MARYRDLGSRPPGTGQQTGAADPLNPYGAGNWTVTFDPNALNMRVAQAEVYHITVDGPVGSKFKVFRNKSGWWDTVLQGWSNSWDPQQPLYVRKDDNLFFYWSSAAAPAPTVRLWLRYDLDLPENSEIPQLRA